MYICVNNVTFYNNIIFGDEDKGFFVILTYNSDDGNVL